MTIDEDRSVQRSAIVLSYASALIGNCPKQRLIDFCSRELAKGQTRVEKNVDVSVLNFHWWILSVGLNFYHVRPYLLLDDHETFTSSPLMSQNTKVRTVISF